MADNVDDIIGKEALKQVDNLEKKLKQADLAMLALSARALELNRNLQNITVPSNLAQLTSQNAQLTSQIQAQAAALNALQTQYSTLTRQRQQSSQRTAEESVNQGILNRNAMEAARINSTLAGAYSRLAAQQNQASRNLQDLIVRGRLATQTQREYDRELRNAQNEFNELNTRVTAADRAVGRFNRNVGNYPMQAARGIKDLLGAFGLVGGVSLIASIAKDIFDTTKEIQSLNNALIQVTGTQEIYAKSQAFLSRISEAYGADIKGLTQQFTQFYVSAKDKISGQEIEQIFESITKAGATMGLSQQQQERAFLALNQMMSKGTVQAEELRGQLGEALPGALGIMAKSLGVTEKQLGQMMKDGKLLSSDVLPKFAKQLEITYGIENVTRIETLTAAQGRLSNSWVEFVKTLNESETGGISQFFTTILNGVNFIAEGLVNINKSLASVRTEFINEATSSQLQYLNAITDVNEREAIANLTRKDAIKNIAEMNEKLAQANHAIEKLDEVTPVNFLPSRLAWLGRARKEADELNASLGTQKGRLNAANQALSELNKKNVKPESKVDLTKQQQKALEDAAKARYDAAKKEIEFKIFLQQNILNNELSSYKDQYNALQKSLALKLMLIQLDYNEQVRLAKGNADKIRVAELDRKTSLIKQEQEGFAKLKAIRKAETADQLNEIKEVKDASEKYQDEKNNRLKESLELNQKITQAENDLVDSKIAKQKELKDATKQYQDSFTAEFMANSGFGETFDTFFRKIDDGTGRMTTNFEQLLKGAENSKEKFAVYFNAIAQSAQEAFAFITMATEKNFSDEKKTLQDQYDVSLKYAGDNKEAQEKLALDLENKKKAIANREAKAKQKQALFNIAVDTAQAIVSLWANPGFPAAIPLAILVGALGVAQIAAVSSQEIPQYYMGGTHDGGLMMVNDALGSSYKETIVTPDGKVSKPQGRNVLMNAPAGTEIYTPEQWDSLQGMLKGRGVEMYQNISTSNGMTKDEMYEVMSNTLGNQPNHSTNFDENGVYKYIDKRGNRTKQNIARGNGRGIKS